MLKLPSTILEKAGTSTRRQYASIVFRCLQQTTSDTNGILTASFENEEDAKMYLKHVQTRVDLSLPCDSAEEAIVLPPLFLRSSVDAICEVNSQLFLVMYATGNIFPVVRLRNTDKLIANTTLLNSLFRVYEALSSERATTDNIDRILNDTNNL
jgi:hypothetical protein